MALFHVFWLAVFSVAAAQPGFCTRMSRVFESYTSRLYMHVYIYFFDICLASEYIYLSYIDIYVVSCRQMSNIYTR